VGQSYIMNGMKALETMRTFTPDSLPDLDTAVLGALELFSEVPVPKVDFDLFSRPLVLGSGGAESTGRILFRDRDAVFAGESTYKEALERAGEGIDGAIIISASGGKHAAPTAEDFKTRGIDAFLLTNNPGALAAEFVKSEQIILFPKNREPYTYNTSTYLGMILASTGEDPLAIHQFLATDTMPRMPDTLSDYDAFFITVPPAFAEIRGMLSAKFDELFGPRVCGRVFTTEEAKHAKTVVPSSKEYFIALGDEAPVGTPERALHLPLPRATGYGAMLALGYFAIGYIQKQHPPYFKEHVISYTKQASEMFGHAIHPIVE